NPLFAQINNHFTRDNIDAMIDNDIGANNDAQGIKDRAHNELLNSLKLAALLAKTGLAKGMAIDLDSQDFHYGTNSSNNGSSIDTGRSGAQMFAQVRLFWEWIKANNMQDRVMVVMTHEFSRSPYNQSLGQPVTVTYDGTPVNV